MVIPPRGGRPKGSPRSSRRLTRGAPRDASENFQRELRRRRRRGSDSSLMDEENGEEMLVDSDAHGFTSDEEPPQTVKRARAVSSTVQVSNSVKERKCVGKDFDLGISPQLSSHADLFTAYAALRTFSTTLFLSPFSWHAFRKALESETGSNPLASEIHIALLRVLAVADDEELGARGGPARLVAFSQARVWPLLDSLTWLDFVFRYAEGRSEELALDSDTPLRAAVHHLGAGRPYWSLTTESKCAILHTLIDDWLETDSARYELQRRQETAADEEKFSSLQSSIDGSGFGAEDSIPLNQDNCAICHLEGDLICCDGCPNVFHVDCIDEPAKVSNSRALFYCEECKYPVPRTCALGDNLVRLPQMGERYESEPIGRYRVWCVLGRLLVFDSESRKPYLVDDPVDALEAASRIREVCPNLADGIESEIEGWLLLYPRGIDGRILLSNALGREALKRLGDAMTKWKKEQTVLNGSAWRPLSDLEECQAYRNRYCKGGVANAIARRKAVAPNSGRRDGGYVPINASDRTFRWPTHLNQHRPASTLFPLAVGSDGLRKVLLFILQLEQSIYGMVEMTMTTRERWRNELCATRSVSKAARLLVELEESMGPQLFIERWREDELQQNRRKSRAAATLVEVLDGDTGNVEYSGLTEIIRAPKGDWYRGWSVANRHMRSPVRETRRAILQAGREKIPGLQYAKMGFAVQTMRSAWRARLSRVRSGAQLAIEARLMGLSIRWSDLRDVEDARSRLTILCSREAQMPEAARVSNLRIPGRGRKEYQVLDITQIVYPTTETQWVSEEALPLAMIKSYEDSVVKMQDKHLIALLGDDARLLLQQRAVAALDRAKLDKPVAMTPLGSSPSCLRPPPPHLLKARTTTLASMLNGKVAHGHSLCVCGRVCDGSGPHYECNKCHQKLHPLCTRPTNSRVLCPRCLASEAMTFSVGNFQRLSLFKSALETSVAEKVSGLPASVPRATLCEICLKEETCGGLLDCSKCGITVHRDCYFGGSADGSASSGPFLCDPCENGGPQPICVLCPVPGGPLRITTTHQFAHPICATFVNETYFDDVTGMIAGVENIDPRRFKLRCTICRSEGSAPSQCTVRTCGAALHPLCARGAGLPVSIEIDEDGNESYVMYCKRHQSRWGEEDEGREESQSLKVVEGLIRQILQSPHSAPFREPVDIIGLGLDDYLSVIRLPMDFGTILRKLLDSRYRSKGEVEKDVHLVFSNCRLYNGDHPTCWVMRKLVKCEGLFLDIWKSAFGTAPFGEKRDGMEEEKSPILEPPRKKSKSENWVTVAEKVLQRLLSAPESEPFREPVDWRGLKLHDYPSVVKCPMDLATALWKLKRGFYKRKEDLRGDVEMIWNNCKLYNGDDPSCEVMRSCAKCERRFETLWAQHCAGIDQTGSDSVQREDLGGEPPKRPRGRPRKYPGVISKVSATPPNGEEQVTVVTRKRLRNPEWKAKTLGILKLLTARKEAMLFSCPVDLEKYPDYASVVTRPMDLGTVRRRLEDGLYADESSVLEDVQRVWANCREYNGFDLGREICRRCDECEELFEKQWYNAGLDGIDGPSVRAERERQAGGKGHLGAQIAEKEGDAVGLSVTVRRGSIWVKGTILEYDSWRRAHVIQFDDPEIGLERVTLSQAAIRTAGDGSCETETETAPQGRRPSPKPSQKRSPSAKARCVKSR